MKLAAGLKLERLPEMLKGLRRHLGDAPKKVRRGVAAQLLRRGMDKLLDPRKPAHANIRAALALAFQGLMRSAEYSINPGTRWRHDFHLNPLMEREGDAGGAANDVPMVRWSIHGNLDVTLALLINSPTVVLIHL